MSQVATNLHRSDSTSALHHHMLEFELVTGLNYPQSDSVKCKLSGVMLIFGCGSEDQLR